MKARLGVIACVLYVIVMALINVSGDSLNLAVVMQSATKSPSPATHNAMFYQGIATLIWGLILLGIYGRDIWRWLAKHKKLLALPLFIIGLVGCAGQAHAVTVEPNEIAFVVPISDSTTDTVVNGDVGYWKSHERPNITEIRVEQGWFQTGATPGSGYFRDIVRVIKVNTTAVNRSWNPPTLDNATCTTTTAGTGFTVEDRESHGLSIGAVVIAHVDNANAALYLSSYGDRPLDDDETSRISVMDTEVRNYIQAQLFLEVGRRDLHAVQDDKGPIFQAVSDATKTWFATKGITIDEVGGLGGLVYDNCNIQNQIDESFSQGEKENQAKAQATIASVNNDQLVAQGFAQATATHIASISNAESQRLQGEALAANPGLLAMEYAHRYGGGCTQYCFGESSGVLPVFNIDPDPTPPSSK